MSAQHNKKNGLSNPASMGDLLRQRRKEQGLTMQQVADQAGLSVGFISQIERDLTAPSLSSLASISRVLKAPMTAFLSQPTSHPELSRSTLRKSFSAGGASYERLSSRFPGSTLRAVVVHEPPGGHVPIISHDGEELIFILQGQLTVMLDGETSVLTPGDSIHFDCHRAHSTHNCSDQICSFLWCGTADIFGEGDSDPLRSHGNGGNKKA